MPLSYKATLFVRAAIRRRSCQLPMMYWENTSPFQIDLQQRQHPPMYISICSITHFVFSFACFLWSAFSTSFSFLFSLFFNAAFIFFLLFFYSLPLFSFVYTARFFFHTFSLPPTLFTFLVLQLSSRSLFLPLS